MSIVICDDCERYIDSDFDADCFIEPPDYLPLTAKQRIDATMTLCENCREKAWDRQQESLMEDGLGPSLLDQQIEAMKFK